MGNALYFDPLMFQINTRTPLCDTQWHVQKGLCLNLGLNMGRLAHNFVIKKSNIALHRYLIFVTTDYLWSCNTTSSKYCQKLHHSIHYHYLL